MQDPYTCRSQMVSTRGHCSYLRRLSAQMNLRFLRQEILWLKQHRIRVADLEARTLLMFGGVGELAAAFHLVPFRCRKKQALNAMLTKFWIVPSMDAIVAKQTWFLVSPKRINPLSLDVSVLNQHCMGPNLNLVYLRKLESILR